MSENEIFIAKLETAVLNKDKKSFIDLIFNLSQDNIVNFTQDKFSHIMEICRCIDISDIDELFDFLKNESDFFWGNALEWSRTLPRDEDDKVVRDDNNPLAWNNSLTNYLLCKFYFSLIISLFDNDKEKTKVALVYNPIACGTLAEMNIDTSENLKDTVHFCNKAKDIFKTNIPVFVGILLNEGTARSRLAEMNINREENLKEVVNLYSIIKTVLSEEDRQYIIASKRERDARFRLVEMNINSRENLENIIHVCEISKKQLLETDIRYLAILMEEGNAKAWLAEIGINPKENLENAIVLYETSQKSLPPESFDYAKSLLDEVDAKQALAEMGIESKKNLNDAIELSRLARQNIPDTSIYYGRSLQNEGAALFKLAEIESKGKDGFEEVVQLFERALSIFPQDTVDHAIVSVNLGCVYYKLACLEFDSVVNLSKAIDLYKIVNDLIPKENAHYAIILLNESDAKLRLAEMGIDSEINLKEALSLCETAKKSFHNTSVDYARALLSEGDVRIALAEMNIESKENLDKSKKLYADSVTVLEHAEDVWTYSLALLRLNNVLKDIFYLTGDVKDLEEWKKTLDDIENRILGKNIMYKDRLLARVHEMRANLFEFDHNSDIGDAVREYGKAFDLSNEPFYKFMQDFCLAKINANRFCNLVSEWKNEKKESVFLDYYNYALFECHLEPIRKVVTCYNFYNMQYAKPEWIL
jgi:tetratricopeptide (TPR) repeat protein